MRNTAFLFADAVEKQIQALSDESFHLRRGDAKLLLEEWYPLSRLALHLKQPGLEVYVEGFDDKRVADGHIQEIGWRERSFDVQITCVEDEESALRRQLMQLQGHAPGAGHIARDKNSKLINATMVAVDGNHNLKKAADGVAKCLTSKAAKSYPANTVLLIAFNDMTLLGFGMWEQLLGLINTQVGLASSHFASVYVINSATNELVKAA